MNIPKLVSFAIFLGLIAMAVGLLTFTLSWNLWGFFGGPLPGYQIFLFPGNLTLIYFWHPIFTEEVNFWPKLFMLLFGQLLIVTSCVLVITFLKGVVCTKLHNKALKSDL
ncbi:hypothetical protein APQ14_18750 [Vibrio toranzoniae]|uniref:Uncharacterized protein n=1 Tax=Vibrio toranzoniae TaxID=1194427 RepID=A0A109D563_9VIBR|nr:hypothetical protein [Vibrio toranzoniae]KWT99101.1 hypothetical protein APQ14_18750 [Vibrio toranzoniae]